MSFQEQLKKARIKAGYTQQEIADKMGITKSTYCGYETGKRPPDVEKIKQRASILNTSGDELLETGFLNVEAVPTLTPLEEEIIEAYRAAPAVLQKAVLDILHIADPDGIEKNEKRHA